MIASCRGRDEREIHLILDRVGGHRRIDFGNRDGQDLDQGAYIGSLMKTVRPVSAAAKV
jgi:hypothetical protein